MTKIQKNIKAARAAKGMTQEDLAQKINVTRQTVSSWETGRTQPDISMLEILSETLGVEIEELIYGKKRNTTVGEEKTDYTSTLITVFSVLGAVLVSVGLILIFVVSWEKMSGIIKGILSFLPAVIGQATGGFVLFKKRDSKAWCEGGAILWIVGVISSFFLVNGVYDIHFDNYSHIYLIIALMVLPVILLLRSVAVLPVFYAFGGIWAVGMAEDVEIDSYYYDVFSSLLMLVITVVLLVLGVYLLRYYRKNDGESHRVIITQWMNAAMGLIMSAFSLSFLIELKENHIILLLLLFTLAFFIISQKNSSFAEPYKPLSFIFMLVFANYSGLGISVSYYDGFGMNSASLVTLLIGATAIAGALIYTRVKFLSRLNIAQAAGFLWLIIIWSVQQIFRDLAEITETGNNTYEISLAFNVFGLEIPVLSVVGIVLDLSVFAFLAFIMGKSATEKKLLPMNLAFISFVLQVMFRIGMSGFGMLTNGVILLVCGALLLFVNFRISKSKKQKDEASAMTVTDGKATPGEGVSE